MRLSFLVAKPEGRCCQGPENHITLNAIQGYIASSVSRDIGCGDFDCPWKLVAPSGQQMNISLYDFAVGNRSKHL